MKIRSILTGATLVVATAVITSQVVSQDTKKPAQQPPAMSPEQQQMMQKWMEFATPNEHHKLLAERVGKWQCAVKMWMEPGAPPEESKASAEYEMALDGRYLMEHVSGNSSMGPFEAMSVTGYDNLKKKYVNGWIDNMGTGVVVAEGEYDAKTKTFTFTGEMPDPMTGKYVKSRSTEAWTSPDRFVITGYGPDKNGKEYKNMEIVCERVK